MITSTYISIRLVGVDGGKNIGILGLDVRDYLAVGAIKSDCLAGIADLSANITSDLLKVDLFGRHSCFSKEDNLQANKDGELEC